MKQAIGLGHTGENYSVLQTAEFSQPGEVPCVEKTGDMGGFGEIVFNNGEEFNVPLSALKYCAGVYAGGWHKCPTFATIPFGKQCRQCSLKDAGLECARCNGSICLSSSPQQRERCGLPHALYIASFGNVLKVGISSSARVEKRWVEQGADFACKALLLENGRQARIAEARLALALGVRSFLKTSEKIKLLLFDSAACRNGLEGAVAKARESYPQNALSDTPVDLSPKYPTKEAFGELKKAQSISGKVIGCKGSLLFLEQEYAGGLGVSIMQNAVYNLSDAVGRIVLEKKGTLAGF